MALLQISDPNAAPRPVGIDLGTTHSLVAYVPAIGAPIVISDCDGESLVPSVVYYPKDGTPIVGKQARLLAREFPSDTIASVKRFMGRGADDPETRRLGPYRFATETGSVVKFGLSDGRVLTAVEVSAEILRVLKENAEDVLGPIAGAVITVPAYFDDAQRQATKDAGKLAGLSVLRLLNEPTAAALAYGLHTKAQGTYAVYDLGGGTFDITVLVLDEGVFQVRSTGGDSQLGGDDMDRALAELLLRELGVQEPSPELTRTLLDASRSIKHALSEQASVEAEIELPDGKMSKHFVTRAALDSLVRPLCERTGVAVRRALRDAGLSVEELDGVILVGGATRTPCVRAYVQELFGREPLHDIDPDQVVALGAAIQADVLAGENPSTDVLLLDVLPLSLGVEAMGGIVEKILPRNTTIPAGAAQVFTTYADNQTGFTLHVVQGERELAEQCRSLARFTLRGIPPMPAGMARLELSFHVDADGLLRVTAKELTTGVEQQVEVKPSYGLAEADIERMLLDAYDHAEGDISARALREERIEAQRILLATRTALRQDASLLEAGEGEFIESAIENVVAACAGDDPRAIHHSIETLDEVGKAFAGRRMDRSIRQALQGQRIETLERETAHAQGLDAHLGKGEG